MRTSEKTSYATLDSSETVKIKKPREKVIFVYNLLIACRRRIEMWNVVMQKERRKNPPKNQQTNDENCRSLILHISLWHNLLRLTVLLNRVYITITLVV